MSHLHVIEGDKSGLEQFAAMLLHQRSSAPCKKKLAISYYSSDSKDLSWQNLKLPLSISPTAEELQEQLSKLFSNSRAR